MAAADVGLVRWALVAVFVSWMPVHASAQPAASFGIDVLPPIEGVGLGLLGVLDYSWLVVDAVDAHDAGRRLERAPACELALGIADLLGAIPAWWQWTRETLPSRLDMALAAPIALSVTGALLVALGISYYAGRAPPPLRAGLTPIDDGAMLLVAGAL